MPSTPTTKSQVQAYRFVLRRMQSALVRKDAVMLHDPMSTHSRATIAGVCLAAIIMVGFVVWGLFSPAPTLPDSGIVIAQPSGQVYVVSGEPKKLTPTFNIASARLLMLADKQGAGGGGEVSEPTVVKDEQLKDVPKDRLTGIQNGPPLLPNDDQRPSENWAVCDTTVVNPSLTESNAGRTGTIETTVLAGVPELGRELAANQALLVTPLAQRDLPADEKDFYLVYGTPTSANQPNSSAVKAKIDFNDANVRGAFELGNVRPRTISTGLLNAIPEVKELEAPEFAGLREPVQFAQGRRVGEVVRTELASGSGDFYVIHRDGFESVKSTTADLIQFVYGSPGGNIPIISGRAIADRIVNHFDDSNFPDVVPEVLDPGNLSSNSAVACLGWTVVRTGNPEPQTTVFISDHLEHEADRVRISTPNASGDKVDFFYMTPGRAAVVHGSRTAADLTNGEMYLISDLGVRFGIPDQETAVALGLANQQAAPVSIIGLLPDGAMLSTQNVMQTYDVVPPVPGQFTDRKAGSTGQGTGGR